MSFQFHKVYLDIVLVPAGLLIMLGYHIFLLYRCIRHPHTTVIGFENTDKRAWVDKVMQSTDRDDVSKALDVISANTTVATFLASVCLTISALIGAWISTDNTVFESKLIYGDTHRTTMSIKYITLLVFFLLAFTCFVHSCRSFIHASYLISTPNSDIAPEYVELAVIRGGDFWSFGLRAVYFATTLLLWFFGPIPMFVSSVVMVALLCYLDSGTGPMKRKRDGGTQTQNKKTLKKKAEDSV